MKILSAFAICTCAWAQTGIDRPQVGKMLDASGTVRTVYGIAASVTLGDPEMIGVVSQACSKTYCLAKTETSIASTAGSANAPTGPALFAFDGDAAFLWFPQSRQLAHWQNGLITLIDSAIYGEVLSIRASAGSVEFAVRRKSGEWIVKLDESVVDSLPRSTGPVMLIPGGVVYATREEIVIRDLRIPLEHVTSFSQMSTSYLQVHAGQIEYVLRVDPGRETLFQLPGVQQ
jgi:hypothetical protein